LLGWAASEADVAVITSDNPRSEEPMAIIREILSGIDSSTCITTVEPDRAAAIRLALLRAEAGDSVLVAGKGHERTQDLGDRVVDFDDRAVITELLEADLLGGRA